MPFQCRQQLDQQWQCFLLDRLELECRILSVDQERRRIALGLKQLESDPWATDIPSKYQAGELVKGKVTKITNFGVFVGLEDGLEGLLHISELSDDKIENPEDVVNVGDELEVKILRVDTEERKIGLSRRRVDWNEEQEAKEHAKEQAAQSGKIDSADLKGGLGSSGPMFSAAMASDAPAEETAPEPAEEPAAEEATSEEGSSE